MGTVDVQVGTGDDDGYWGNGYSRTSVNTFAGKFTTNPRHAFARFTSVTVPVGATIDVAYFSAYFVSHAKDGTGVHTDLHLEDEDDPGFITSEADGDARVTTTAKTAWDDVNGAAAVVQSDSVVDVVQEIVDRGGWNSGQAMQLLWKEDGTGTDDKYYWIDAYEQVRADHISLHIEYTEAAAGGWAGRPRRGSR